MLQPKDNGTLIRWQQEITALDSRGDEIVAEFNRERYEALMISLNQMLAHYLETGKSLELPLDI